MAAMRAFACSLILTLSVFCASTATVPIDKSTCSESFIQVRGKSGKTFTVEEEISNETEKEQKGKEDEVLESVVPSLVESKVQASSDGAQHRVETKVTKHGRFYIRTFTDSPVYKGGQMRWNIMAKDCNSSVIHKLVTECKPDGMEANYNTSDQNASGLCFVVLTGTEDEIKEELDQCSSVLPDDIIVESDSEVNLLPGELDNESDVPILLQSSPSTLWGLDRIDDRSGPDEDYSPPQTGKGVHVFVADTGIRTTHKDFGGRAFRTLDATDDQLKVCTHEDKNCADDRHGHGTHCAGIIGGTEFGVAKDAKLHAVKIFKSNGRMKWSWLTQALDWVKQQQHMRPAVFSASLGGKGTHQVFKTAIDKVTRAGVMVVVAAGNENMDACSITPAFVPSAITVGSVKSGDKRSGFSNYGRCLDLFAPGEAITSASHRSDDGKATKSGTSFAAPHVSGAAALLFEANPTKTVNDVGNLLLAHATPGEVHDSRSESPNLLLYVGPPSGYEGCFMDMFWRDLLGGPNQLGYTVASCREYARHRNMKYFALQQNGRCFTDNTFATPDWLYSKRPDSECGGRCSGEKAHDTVLKCGGEMRNAVYKTVL